MRERSQENGRVFMITHKTYKQGRRGLQPIILTGPQFGTLCVFSS